MLRTCSCVFREHHGGVVVFILGWRRWCGRPQCSRLSLVHFFRSLRRLGLRWHEADGLPSLPHSPLPSTACTPRSQHDTSLRADVNNDIRALHELTVVLGSQGERAGRGAQGDGRPAHRGRGSPCSSPGAAGRGTGRLHRLLQLVTLAFRSFDYYRGFVRPELVSDRRLGILFDLFLIFFGGNHSEY